MAVAVETRKQEEIEGARENDEKEAEMKSDDAPKIWKSEDANSTAGAEDQPSSSSTKSLPKSTGKRKQSNFSTLGRRGDPRMHRAVAARLANPASTLFQALKAGGFFPDLPEEDLTGTRSEDISIKDTDGVTLSQRKNQLSRRLRIARKKGAKMDVAAASGNSSMGIWPNREGTAGANPMAMMNAMAMQSPDAQTRMQILSSMQAMWAGEGGGTGPSMPPLARGGTAAALRGYAPEGAAVPKNPVEQQILAQYKSMKNGQQGMVHSGASSHHISAPTPSHAMTHDAYRRAQLLGCTVRRCLEADEARKLKKRTSKKAKLSTSNDSVAVTAANLGMSKEQFESMIGDYGGSRTSAGTSSSLPPSSRSDDAKLKSALDLYRTEHASLIKRCLIASGFGAERTEECDSLYLKFCERAADQERKRLDRLIGATGQISCFAGRHVHRLDGQCGHRVVLHKPKEGVPHIDFIVNDRVECYHGVAGIKHKKSGKMMYPSKYSCDDLDCCPGEDNDAPCKHAKVDCGETHQENHTCHEMTMRTEPTVLELTDVADREDFHFNPNTLFDDTILGDLGVLGQSDDESQEGRKRVGSWSVKGK